MSNTPYIVTTPRRGGRHGTEFNDFLCVPDPSASTINRIIVRHGCLIDSLEVYYSWNAGESIAHGGPGGQKVALTFEPDEFITKIDGRADDGYIIGLCFMTNKRTWGPYGGSYGVPFSWGTTDEIHSHQAPTMRLIAIAGNAGGFLFGLQATFAEYRDPPVKSAKYECLPAATGATSSAACISEFTRHLMSPIVTLVVGQSEQQVKFYAYEDTLCQVPFFKAALLGGFQEAAKKTIDMPEDAPDKVSCLVEYLYTGNYTYIYDPTTAQYPSGSKLPTGDLAEGVFHIGVYVIAAKYICPGLVDMAKKNFVAVLEELDDIDKLRLWKAAYDEGIHLEGQRGEFQHYSSGQGFVKWVGGLFRENNDEVKAAILEHPVLAFDLLRIATDG